MYVYVRANVCVYIYVHARTYACVTFAELQPVDVLSSNMLLLHSSPAVLVILIIWNTN